MNSEQPILIPAQMLNQFIYCPRSFHFQWVDKRFESNADVEIGKFTHRVVDATTQTLPNPDLPAEFTRAHSVRLESETLGLVAILDRVEEDDGYVVPVDIKKGSPQEDGSPWDSDRAQILTQAALLADAGYQVRNGALYYAETHQKVVVPFNNSMIDEVRAIATDARAVAASSLPPPPLIHSSKCPRCSLVGLCLPDETNVLLAREEQPPRSILPRDPDCRPFYITEQGAFVGIKGGRLRVTKKPDLLVDARLLDISQLCVYGNVQVSTQALAELWSRGIPVLWFSYGGWLRGWAQGEMSKYIDLRRKQVALHAQGGFAVSQQMIAAKIKNSRTLLRRNQKADASKEVSQLQGLAAQALTVTSYQSLLGIEGTAARIYFSAFPKLFPADSPEAARFIVNGRSRRPAPDPINALLGFTYSLLTKDIVAICLGVGLDPYLGFMHQPRYGRPSMALDLMEEFRPLIADSTVLNVLNTGEISAEDFNSKAGAAWLTQGGRRKVIRAYERRLEATVTHPVFGYKISYRRIMDVQARILAAVIIGEIATYTPMTTR